MALVVGLTGACRKQELSQLKIEDIEDMGSAALIKIPDTKTKRPRAFTITGKFYNLYKKYADLRPSNVIEHRFFLNYQNKKCTRQPGGVNKFGNIPKQIATYLNLKNPELYTGHCFRRSSATILVDAGGDITTLKRFGGWRSTTVAESYIDESITNKMQVANNILRAVTDSSTSGHNPSQSQTNIEHQTPTHTLSSDTLTHPSQSQTNVVHQTLTHSLSSNTLTHPISFTNCNNNKFTINIFNDSKKN